MRRRAKFYWGLGRVSRNEQSSVTGSLRPSARDAEGEVNDLQFLFGGVEARTATPARLNSAVQPRVDQAYGKLPLSFEANRGQTDSQVKFLSRRGGSTLFLTSTEAVLVLTKSEVRAKRDKFRLVKPDLTQPEKVTRTVVRMKLVGGKPHPQVAGVEELPGKANYFIGNDPSKWRTNVPTYERVEYRDVYPGVNLVYYGNQRQLEYDFVVAPGADPRAIRLAFHGVDKLTLDAEGNLILHTAGGEVRQYAPIVYQESNGVRQQIFGRYILRGKDRVGFQVAAYDRTKALVIDPVLAYSTYFGGPSENPASHIAVDGSGSAYVTGFVKGPDFPTVNALQPASGGSQDAFVAKLNPTGSALVYSTYLGGSGGDTASGIAVDAAGNAYVTGGTNSTNFPTANALQPALGPGGSAFVAKLNPTGSALVYSTYLGGASPGGGAGGAGIAVDAAGNAYVTGCTGPDFPTVNPLQPAFGGSQDAFVAKLNPMGSALVYSTYLGGSGGECGSGIAVDASGSAYVIGGTESTNFPTVNAAQPIIGGMGDAFVAKLNPTGSALVYSTYLGGSEFDYGLDIAVDGSGSAYVTGYTESPDFPTVNALQPTLGGSAARNAFVAKLDPAGVLVYSTYLGGSSHELGLCIAVDASGNAYVGGQTGSTDFPTVNSLQPLLGFDNAFVAKLNAAGTALVYSTYLGGSGTEEVRGIAVDTSGNAYIVGFTESFDFPTVNPFGLPTLNPDAPPPVGFVAKLLPSIPSFNSPSGSTVTVPLGSGVAVTFPGVSSQGNSTLSTSSTGPTPPAGFSLGTPPTYYDISTTATFTSPVKVCVRYDPEQFGDPNSLRLLHFEGNAWVDVTTSNDTGGERSIICGQVSSFSPFLIAQRVGSPLTSLGPANVWVGLKNSDDVGIRFDLRAEVYRNVTQLVGSGEIGSVAGGSSGFNNAKQNAIAMMPSAGVTFLSGDALSIRLLVRNACEGSGKNSGTARLWYNENAANSRVAATIGNPATYYLLNGFALGTAPGTGPKNTIDVAAGAKCSPYKEFGKWSRTLP